MFGEDHLRKIIVQWETVPEALEYQVCHNCVFHDGNDNDEDEEMTIHVVAVGREGECGGRPCYILPGAPLGRNTFHVRVRTSTTTTSGNDEVLWSEWSEPRNFNVDQIGKTEHEEL